MVKDIGMKKFLWYDYFHDSIISNISLGTASKNARWREDSITMTIHCDRECERFYLARPAKARPDNWQECITKEEFTYLVSFQGVASFEIKNDGNPII